MNWFNELYRIIKLISYGGTSKKLTAEFIAALDETLTPGGDSGGGSFLSANIARVDPSGNDGTGEVGDLSKPFLTVQAAVDAFVDAMATFGVIDIGANNYEAENLTIASEITLMFKGAGVASEGGVLGGLTLTAAVTIYLKDCMAGFGGITTSDNLDLILDNVDLNSIEIESTAGNTKHLNVIARTSGYNCGDIIADDIADLNIIGITPKSGGGTIQIADNAANVLIKNCGFPPTLSADVPALFNLDFGAGLSVTIINSIVGDVTTDDGFVTFIDSRSNGSIDVGDAGGITYADILLKSVPPGGTTGQVLDKASGDDFDTQWNDLA